MAISSLVSDDLQIEMAKKGKIPVMKDKASYINVLGSDRLELNGKNVKALFPKRYGEIVVLDKYASAANSALNTAFADVVAGKKNINTALRDAQETANQKIAAIPK